MHISDHTWFLNRGLFSSFSTRRFRTMMQKMYVPWDTLMISVRYLQIKHGAKIKWRSRFGFFLCFNLIIFVSVSDTPKHRQRSWPENSTALDRNWRKLSDLVCFFVIVEIKALVLRLPVNRAKKPVSSIHILNLQLDWRQRPGHPVFQVGLHSISKKCHLSSNQTLTGNTGKGIDLKSLRALHLPDCLRD